MNLGGTTTTGPLAETSSFIAVIENNRRIPVAGDVGAMRSSSLEAILTRCVEDLFSRTLEFDLLQV
jgi:hypothetical protein